MDMAKKTSLFDDLLFIASKLPWWLSLAIALGSGIYLHSVASAPLPTTFDPHNFGSMLANSAFRSVASFAQFILPTIFGLGVVFSILARRKRRHLLTSVTTPGGNTLASISWREFELLVGEALRRQGFAVQETGGNGPDGGVDLIARKEGEKYLVQCKQWRSMRVGVPVVRELYGAMAADGAVGGFVITCGQFSKPAREFASGRNVQLVDGAALNQWIALTRKPVPKPSSPVVDERVEPVIDPTPPHAEPVRPAPEPVAAPKAPACPHCRKPMVVRVARTGANAGGDFWGCSNYPKCRGLRPIFPPMQVK